VNVTRTKSTTNNPALRCNMCHTTQKTPLQDSCS
jgi:hypothetical protein